MEEKKKFKGINRVIIAIAIITCLLIGANVYASTAGYGNIFFMIRNIFTNEEVQSGQNLFSDRDITVSYSSIEIAEGLNVQIQRVTIEDNLTTIYVHVDKDTVSLNENPLRYKVYDESNNLLAEYTNNRSIVECVFTDAIKINQKVSENAKLRLEIYASSGKKLSNITIDLANKELLVDGEKVEKLSEIELKKYLGVFATLSEFKDEKNQPDYLIVVAEELNDRILHNPSFKSDYYYLQRELTDNIVKSFYWNDDIDLVDLLDKYADENGIRYDKSKDVYIHEDELGILTGECINISNISYKDNVYTIDFTFYSYYDLQDGANIEDVTHYEATIQLKYNPNSEYSKYKIVSISDPTVVKHHNIDVDKYEGKWYKDGSEVNIVYISSKHVYFDWFISSDYYTNIEAKLDENKGTFKAINDDGQHEIEGEIIFNEDSVTVKVTNITNPNDPTLKESYIEKGLSMTYYNKMTESAYVPPSENMDIDGIVGTWHNYDEYHYLRITGASYGNYITFTWRLKDDCYNEIRGTLNRNKATFKAKNTNKQHEIEGEIIFNGNSVTVNVINITNPDDPTLKDSDLKAGLSVTYNNFTDGYGNNNEKNTGASYNILYGDVTLDGIVNGQDYVRIQKFISGTAEFTEEQRKNGDLNLDGKINNEDAEILQSYLAGGIQTLPFTGNNTSTNTNTETNINTNINSSTNINTSINSNTNIYTNTSYNTAR